MSSQIEKFCVRILDKLKEHDEEICLELIAMHPLCLEHVKNQTPKICDAAVSKNPKAIKYVIDQTDDLCKKAVFADGLLLEHVKVKTPELCKLAFSVHRGSIMYIPDEMQTSEMALSAMNRSPNFIQYVSKRLITEEIWRKAGKQILNFFTYDEATELGEPYVSIYINKVVRYFSRYQKNLPSDVILQIISKNPQIIKECEDPTEEMCVVAVKSNPSVVNKCRIQYPAAIKAAIMTNPEIIRSVPIPDLETYDHLAAIDPLLPLQSVTLKKNPVEKQFVDHVLASNPYMVSKIKARLTIQEQREIININPYLALDLRKPHPEILLEAVKLEPTLIRHITEQTEDLCIAAVERNPILIRYINNPTEATCVTALAKDPRLIIYIERPGLRQDLMKQNLTRFKAKKRAI